MLRWCLHALHGSPYLSCWGSSCTFGQELRLSCALPYCLSAKITHHCGLPCSGGPRAIFLGRGNSAQLQGSSWPKVHDDPRPSNTVQLVSAYRNPLVPLAGCAVTSTCTSSLSLIACRFAFGKTPGPSDTDEAFSTPCFSQCPSKKLRAGSCGGIELGAQC